MKIIKIYLKFRFLQQFLWSLALSTGAAILFMVFTFIKPVETSVVGWQKTSVISLKNVKVDYFRTKSKGNVVAVVYESNDNRTRDIYISISLNQGSEFLKPVKVWGIKKNIDLNYGLRPDVSISGNGHICVVWQKFEESDSIYNIYYSVSEDFGRTWKDPEVLKQNKSLESGKNISNYLPLTFYDDENQLHIFYHVLFEKSFNLFHVIRTKDMNFSEPEKLLELPENFRGAFFPSIVTSGRYFFILWQGKSSDSGVLKDDLFFIRSLNYGESWTDPVKITNGSGSSSAPALLFYNKKLYCVYQNNDEKNWQIKMLISSDWGESWGINPLQVSDTNVDCYSPTLVKGETELKAFWYDNRDAIYKIYSRSFNLQENKFSKESVLTGKRYSSTKPEVISFGKKMILFYDENNKVMARISDISVLPPIIFSSTHPENRWVQNNRAVITWKAPKDDSGVSGYATIVNNDPFFDPTVQNIEGNVRRTIIPFLKDGRSYFHIRVIDGAGNYSRTVHYPLFVSRNPLPIPDIISKTHPEGKPSVEHNALFSWRYTEIERTKGFLYNLRKGLPGKPDKYVENFNVAFENLKEGRYFFSLQAVDKANRPGNISTYEIIVGSAKQIDPSIYKRIADRTNQEFVPDEAGKSKKKYLKSLPFIAIEMPFETDKPWNKDFLSIKIDLLNLKNAKLEGIYYRNNYLKKREKFKIAKNNKISFYNLQDGKYRFEAKARYSYFLYGEKITRWTSVFKKNYEIKLPPVPFDFFDTLRFVMQKVITNILVSAVSILLFIVILIYIIFNRRLVFVVNRLNFKIVNYIKLIFS